MVNLSEDGAAHLGFSRAHIVYVEEGLLYTSICQALINLVAVAGLFWQELIDFSCTILPIAKILARLPYMTGFSIHHQLQLPRRSQ